MKEHSPHVVVNRQADGSLAVALVFAHDRGDAVNKRSRALNRGGHHNEIIAVSGGLPSEHGIGGSQLREVQPRSEYNVSSKITRHL